MKTLDFGVLTLKNFLSFGNETTAIRLDNGNLTVIMGQNFDTGGEDSRNGVGKSTLMDALTYCIFGETNRGLTNSQLVNNLIRKGQQMLVTLTFRRGDFEYLIERGEKPSKLNLFRRPVGCIEDFKEKDGDILKYDITKSTKPATSKEIADIVGFDSILFEYLIANSSETIPFLKLPADKRNEIMEKLFGFELLTNRADELKEERKEINKNIISLEASIQATKQANDRIRREIDGLNQRSAEWESNHTRSIADLKSKISRLEQVNIQDEIDILNMIAELDKQYMVLRQEQSAISSKIRELNRDQNDIESTVRQYEQKIERNNREITKNEADLQVLDKSECPTCHQHWEADPNYRETLIEHITRCKDENTQHEVLINETNAGSTDITLKLVEQSTLKEEVDSKISQLASDQQELTNVELTFKKVEDAIASEATLAQFRARLTELEADSNPHLESIDNFQTNAIKQIDDTELVQARNLLEHYQLLITLLTSKDSFLRKSIIERWLPKMNQRISHYLTELQLPHKVRFLSDLSMEITDYGKEFSWGSLSKGQRQRVTIALNLAFQDVFEFMNYKINTLMIDELIDNGICNRGAENAVNILEDMARTKNKTVFLVTHRQDIASRIEDHITVKMKNKLSWIEQD